MTSRVQFSRTFDKHFKRLKRRYPNILKDVKDAIGLLTKQPETGSVIKGSGGFRKLRVKNTDASTGKRGEYRLIYTIAYDPELTLYILAIYSKSQKSDLTKQELLLLQSDLEDMDAS